MQPDIDPRAVRTGPLAGFLVTELSASLALPLGYGIAGGSCAPPGISCFMQNVGCAAVCVDAWTQFPAVTAYGAALGAVPAGLVALLLLGSEVRKGPRYRPASSVAPMGLGIVGMLGTVLLVMVVFPNLGGYRLALVAVLGVALALAIGGGWIGVERLARRCGAPPSG